MGNEWELTISEVIGRGRDVPRELAVVENCDNTTVELGGEGEDGFSGPANSCVDKVVELSSTASLAQWLKT